MMSVALNWLHRRLVKQGRVQKALFDVAWPRWLYRGPRLWQRLNWWWLGWYGYLFMPGPDDE